MPTADKPVAYARTAGVSTPGVAGYYLLMPEQKPIAILFLCTGNACRSQMAEALLRHDGGQRFVAHSAGSHPAGFIHGLAVDTMEDFGVSLAEQYSKSWDAMKDHDFDAVITLCDNAVALPCPVWPGSPLTAHWSLPDPAYHPGGASERLDFSMTVAARLRAKVRGLIALDWSAPRDTLAAALERLGEI